MAASHVGRLELISGMMNGLKCIGMHKKKCCPERIFCFQTNIEFLEMIRRHFSALKHAKNW